MRYTTYFRAGMPQALFFHDVECDVDSHVLEPFVFQDPDLTLTIYRVLSLYGRIIIVVVRISLVHCFLLAIWPDALLVYFVQKVSSKWDGSGIGPATTSVRPPFDEPSICWAHQQGSTCLAALNGVEGPSICCAPCRFSTARPERTELSGGFKGTVVSASVNVRVIRFHLLPFFVVHLLFVVRVASYSVRLNVFDFVA